MVVCTAEDGVIFVDFDRWMVCGWLCGIINSVFNHMDGTVINNDTIQGI